MLPPIDLIIAIDTTSSMTGEVASLREEIAGLSELLADLTEDAAVGIIDFQGRMRPAAGLARRPAPAHRPAVGAAAGGVRAIHATGLGRLQR